MSTARAAASSRVRPAAFDAIALLEADHKAVDGLFAEFESSTSARSKRALVQQICTELTVHAQIEEEIFYPAVKMALKDKELVPEAIVEHASLKGLIATIEGAEPDGEMYDATVKVLSEYVKHHVKEERTEIFPKVRNSSLDTEELGALLAARKEELLAARA
jgi:hemerythrin superfamily protein